MFQSVEGMLQLGEEKGLPLWRVVMEDDMIDRSVTEEESFEMMTQMYQAMKECL